MSSDLEQGPTLRLKPSDIVCVIKMIPDVNHLETDEFSWPNVYSTGYRTIQTADSEDSRDKDTSDRHYSTL